MTQSKCRWGIMGTAAIAGKNWRAIHYSGNGTVVAVASRNEESASRFIDRCQSLTPLANRPEAVGSYQALLERDDIDAVYIPLPTALRHPWVIKAAEAGKHVLCEKPIASSATEAAEMVDACRQAGVQFMDGVMFMHSDRLTAMRATLEDPLKVGRLRRIATHFSFSSDTEFQTKNIRVMRQLEPYGCLGDLGWYTVRMSLWAMNYALPSKVSGRILTELCGEGSDGPVPGEFSGELFFDGGVSASFYNSFLTQNQQTAFFSGDRGYVTLDDFVLPWMGAELAWEDCQHEFDGGDDRFFMGRHVSRHKVHEYSNGAPGAQEVKLMQRFGEIVLEGKRDLFWPQVALGTQRVLDALLTSAHQGGVLVDVDRSEIQA